MTPSRPQSRRHTHHLLPELTGRRLKSRQPEHMQPMTFSVAWPTVRELGCPSRNSFELVSEEIQSTPARMIWRGDYTRFCSQGHGASLVVTATDLDSPNLANYLLEVARFRSRGQTCATQPRENGPTGILNQGHVSRTSAKSVSGTYHAIEYRRWAASTESRESLATHRELWRT